VVYRALFKFTRRLFFPFPLWSSFHPFSRRSPPPPIYLFPECIDELLVNGLRAVRSRFGVAGPLICRGRVSR